VRIATAAVSGMRLALHAALTEAHMATTTHEIQWQRDVDAAIAEAARSQRPALLDFSAAPQ
jgi:hypothetical protein